MDPAPVADTDDLLDPAETVVFNALRALACTTGAVDPTDPEDCASVAAEAVRALRASRYLPTPADTSNTTTQQEGTTP